MRYAFIERHCDSYPVQALCGALQVSDSGFAAWQRGAGPRKWLCDEELLKMIREIHQGTKAAYGSRADISYEAWLKRQFERQAA